MHLLCGFGKIQNPKGLFFISLGVCFLQLLHVIFDSQKIIV
jgi:organic hydroperoxide reductase OsmC/OhrA